MVKKQAIWILALGLFPVMGVGATNRPNVIVILSDDQGYGDFSCHGNPVLKTPNLDRMHAQSIRFTDFHVAPMCTPTRSQLLTGVDALRNGATSVCAGRSFVRPQYPLLSQYFQAAGYKTAIFGKWHLGDSYPNLPEYRGFDESVYHLGWGITSMADTWQNDYFDGRFFHRGVLQSYKGYCTDVWFDLAKRWITKQKQANEPFFLYLPTNAPHGPHWAKDADRQRYEGKGPAAFFGMMANLDENLGKLDQTLRELDLFDNTIVVYLNDNGGTAGVRVFNAGLRGSKTQYYDGGHRAALFVRWPAGKLQDPTNVKVLTQVQDLAPTLLDLAEIRPKKNPRFDGVSLAGLLRNPDGKIADRMLVVQYGQKPEKWESAVLWNAWRLVKGAELYDLEKDPGQQIDLAGKRPDLVAQMRQHYERWWGEVSPKVNEFVPIVVGSPLQNPVCLSAADWANVYCDNMGHLREGINRNGPWHVEIAETGRYTIELRRWPRDANASMSAGVPEFQARAGKLPAGKAMPIAKARLKVGGKLDATQVVPPDAKSATFSVELRKGDRFEMQSWLLDANGRELSGAYFAYVRRL